jgi:hypothetical protein
LVSDQPLWTRRCQVAVTAVAGIGQHNTEDMAGPAGFGVQQLRGSHGGVHHRHER